MKKKEYQEHWFLIVKSGHDFASNLWDGFIPVNEAIAIVALAEKLH